MPASTRPFFKKTDMKIQQIEEIIACLPNGRTAFHYYPDRYALLLLAWASGEGIDTRALRAGPFGRLLDKPSVREVLARAGKGELRAEDFNLHWPTDTPAPAQTFLLSLDIWNRERSRYNQTSRGDANLVLQLNFSNQHEQHLPAINGPMLRDTLISWGHPVMKPGEREYFRNTLAWARIDLDFGTGEALIEEIQNDWLRNAERALKWMQRYQQAWNVNARDIARFRDYCEQVLAPLRKCWSEAMLSAALWFLHEELGLHDIWYHSADTGRRIKRIDHSAPPRSLYTRLPRRFCFQQTQQAPEMLTRSRGFMRRYRRIENPSWYRLEIPTWH